jgi:hypothetical protein
VDIWTRGSLAFLSGMVLLALFGVVLWLGVPRLDEFERVHKTLGGHTDSLGRIENQIEKLLLTQPVQTGMESQAPNPERNVVLRGAGTLVGEFRAGANSGVITVVPEPQDPEDGATDVTP